MVGIGVITDLIIGAEGGDMECSRWQLSLSASAEPSTPYTLLGRLSILTDTGLITIGIRAINPDTLSALVSMITSLISDMGYTVPPIGSKGDDE